MNIYFLVEGRSTEIKIYPKWLAYLIPKLTRVNFYDQVQVNNYYIISGRGYPNILGDGLENALDKIQETKKYDYLVICVDSDEETVQERFDCIQKTIEEKSNNLGNTKPIIIIQNRCIETWLLGNRKIFDSRQPQQSPLSEYVKYYDVYQNDPELMGQYNDSNHADFHCKYLKEVFRAKNINYSKKLPGDAQKQHYLEQIIKRTQDSQHLSTFQFFLEFCKMIRNHIS